MSNKSLKFGLLGGLSEVLYVVLIASLLWRAENWLDGPGVQNIILMLLVFVFSAALSGLLILGYPVYLVTQKNYRGAIISVLISLAVILILLAVGLVITIIF